MLFNKLLLGTTLQFIMLDAHHGHPILLLIQHLHYLTVVHLDLVELGLLLLHNLIQGRVWRTLGLHIGVVFILHQYQLILLSTILGVQKEVRLNLLLEAVGDVLVVLGHLVQFCLELRQFSTILMILVRDLVGVLHQVLQRRDLVSPAIQLLLHLFHLHILDQQFATKFNRFVPNVIQK